MPLGIRILAHLLLDALEVQTTLAAGVPAL
jgi:hypothetical protein